uniref:Trp-Asp repeats containing protein n=1 Tax=Mycena chlorophos TaxID=658473 RepID=A0ABQ0M7Z2_MYCCL|nr:Trp-Asp repeats containing protein [Mycena chlorophos]
MLPSPPSTLRRPNHTVSHACIRADGKLVVAGDDSGLVQIFDINSRAILRTLDSHKQPTHVTKFSRLEPTQVLSCSDDTTAKLWDVPSQSAITTFTSHSDYIRSGQVSTTNPNLVLTGSYDGTVRLFDSRTGHCEMTMGDGDTPVEQVLMFPSGSVAVSSAGPILRVWDLVAGGRCTRALSNHQKTLVKVYDVSNYKVVHTMRYPAPILCLAVSPDDTHIAAGMSDGTLSVRRRQPKPSEAAGDPAFSAAALKSGTYESFLGASFSGLGQGRVKQKTKAKAVGDINEFRVESRRAKRLKDYDRFLKNFKYSAALDAVLRKQVPPATTFSLIQELIHRDGLRIALAGRDDVLLEPVLRLLVKYVADPRFGEMACDVAGIVIEMYTPVLGQSPLIDSLFLRLRKKVLAELRFQKEVVKTKGALDMLIASASLAST